MDFESLKTQVENRILETYCAAEKYFGPCFDLPTVTYTLRGRVAGTARYPANTINFNKEILLDNPEAFINRTPAHEVAHLITFKMFGASVQPHGKEWIRVMGILGLPAVRCHSYVVKTKNEYICKCENKIHYLSTIRHNKIQKSKQFWYCKTCEEQLVWKKLCCQERNLIPI
jgi:SprT protein